MTKRVTAAEAIAVYFACDIGEVRDAVYQPTLFSNPSVYVDGNSYYCSPTSRQKPPIRDRDGMERGFVWEEVWEWRGRKVYRSRLSDMNSV